MRMFTAWMPALVAALAFTGIAAAQTQSLVIRDIEAKNPKRLSKDELSQLIPGAKMSRVAPSGSTHLWSNDSGGNFVISSDNRGAGAPVRIAGKATSSTGKWHISDDGRYCVLFEWGGTVPTEEWCRYILQTSDGYYMTKSDSVGTERVFPLEIKK